MFKYNYVFFNSPDHNPRKKDPDGYYKICVEDLENLDNVQVVSYPLDYAVTFVRYLYSFHHTPKINNILKLPLKKLWYPFYIKSKFDKKKPICFVMASTYLPVDYLRYLKRKYPTARFVKVHRDLIELWKMKNPQWTDEVVREIFDLNFTFDKKEAERLGWEYFDEFESITDISYSIDYPLSDIFFAGVVKDRLPKLLEAYKIFTDAGLKCNYYLLGVPEEEQKQLPGVEYSKHFLSYREMLYRTVNSRCILEINQGGASGYTSRFLEAVMYNKKLITNNIEIKNSKLYDSRFIQCIDDINDINTAFVKQEEEVDYQYDGEFSPIRLIEKIDVALRNLDYERK